MIIELRFFSKQDSEGEGGSDSNQQLYTGRVYKHVINTPNKDLHHSTPSNTYRRRRNLHSHHHYQRVRLKSAPPTGGGFLYNFNYHDSMVVSGIGAAAPNMNDEDHSNKATNDYQKVINLHNRTLNTHHDFARCEE